MCAIELCHTARVRCRQGVTIKQELGLVKLSDQRWREFKKRESLLSGAEDALFLLDRGVILVFLCFTELIVSASMCGAELSK